MRFLVSLSILLLFGCASLPPGEKVYQVVSAVDFAQTVHIARRPECFHELGFPTAEVIGSHPRESSVEGWWAAQAVTHAVISRWLHNQWVNTDSDRWKIAYRSWQFLTIGYSTYNIASNHELGLEPFGSQRSERCERRILAHGGH